MKMFHNAKFKAGQKTGAGKKEAERARGREIVREEGKWKKQRVHFNEMATDLKRVAPRKQVNWAGAWQQVCELHFHSILFSCAKMRYA